VYLLAALTCGLFTTYLVAYQCVVTASRPIARRSPFGIAQHEVDAVVQRYGDPNWAVRHARGTKRIHRGYIATDVLVIGATPSEDLRVSEVHAGWPWLCFHGGLRQVGAEGRIERVGTWLASTSTPKTRSRYMPLSKTHRVVPFKPRWPFFIASTLTYALAYLLLFCMLMVPFHLARTLRARRRCRLGRCPQCGYRIDEPGLDHCSECGWSREPAP
jgi:hypothetical protein